MQKKKRKKSRELAFFPFCVVLCVCGLHEIKLHHCFLFPWRLLAPYLPLELALESQHAAHSPVFSFPLAPHFKSRSNKYMAI